jgi:uncharacterized protein (DUF2147 family)
MNIFPGGVGRRVRAQVISLMLMAAALSVVSLPGRADAAAAAPNPIVGIWNVTYGAPATVAMTLSRGVYTVKAETPTEVVGSSCFLPAGTVIATFSRKGRHSYAGKHGLWFTNNCSFDFRTRMTLRLSGNGKTLTGHLAKGADRTVVFTKAYRPKGANPVPGDWHVTYGAPATVKMTLAKGVYTERAKTPVQVTGASCDLPSGTVIATFAQTGPSTYIGVHGLWFTSDCSFDTWTAMSLTLSKNKDKLTAKVSSFKVVFTKARS